MAISDAQFAAFLRSSARKTILCEMKFAYQSAGAPAEGTLYLANNAYITKRDEAPAATSYMDRIVKAGSMGLRVNEDYLQSGLTQVSVGDMTLSNADGGLDFMLPLIVDGREARFYIGHTSWRRADFRAARAAVVEFVEASSDMEIAVRLRDHRVLLDKAIAGDVVTDERRKPLVFSGSPIDFACSIEPVLKTAATLQYYILQNFAPAVSGDPALVALRDNGLSLAGTGWTETNATFTANAATDTLTRVAHGRSVDDVVSFDNDIFAGLAVAQQYWVIAAGLTANDFRLSLTKGGAAVDLTGTTFAGATTMTSKRYFDNARIDGTVQLSSSPAGRLTADVVGFPPSFNGLSGRHEFSELIRAMLLDYSTATVEETSFTAYLGGGLAQGRIACAVLQRANLLDILDEIAKAAQAFFGPDRLGKFRIGRLDLSALSTATATRMLGRDDLFNDPVVRNAQIITGIVAALSRRNYRPLTYGEFAGAVDSATRAMLSAEYRLASENTAPVGTSYATNWQSYHLSSVRTDFRGAFVGSGLYPLQQADEILGDLKPHVQTIVVETDLRAFDWNLGDVVAFTYPRYGFNAGRNCRITGIDTDFDTEAVRLTLLTQITPNVARATYN